MNRISGSRACHEPSIETCALSRNSTKTRFRGLAISCRDASMLLGSDRSDCGPPDSMRTCSKLSTFCSLSSSKTSNSSAFKSSTG